MEIVGQRPPALPMRGGVSLELVAFIWRKLLAVLRVRREKRRRGF